MEEEIEYVFNRIKNNKKVFFKEDTIKNVRFVFMLDENFLFQMENDPEIMGYSGDDEINYIVERTNLDWKFVEWVLWYRECYYMKNDMLFYDHENCVKCGSNNLRKKELEDEIMSEKIVCLDCKTEMIDDYESLKLLEE